MTGPGTRGFRGFFFSGTTASGTEAMHPTRGRLSSSRKADARWGARRRYDRWFRATPPARRFGVCARADAARTTPRRVRALVARSSAALAGVMVDIPKSGRCGVFLQCGRGQCDETRER